VRHVAAVSSRAQYRQFLPSSSTQYSAHKVLQHILKFKVTSNMNLNTGKLCIINIVSEACHTSGLVLNITPCSIHKSKPIPKGKAVPLQARKGPEGSRKLRFPDFVTTAQDGGKVVNLTHRLPLPPGNTPGTHFCYRLSRPQGHSAIGSFLCQ